MHTADYLVFDRSEYDAFVTSLGSQSASAIHEAIMADRDALECLARLRLKTTIREGRWAFDVTCHTQTPGFSHDPRDSGGYCTSIFHMEQDSEHSNLARAVDLTNSGDLEGTGLNSWLVDQARWRFERIAGPDPWICGSLSHVDADNERRVPFWRRHVDGAVEVDEYGCGAFEGPWKRAFNPYRCTVAVHPVSETGALPRRTDRDARGYLYWHGDRIGFKWIDAMDARIKRRPLRSMYTGEIFG